MLCNQCGKELPPEARYCLHCGTPAPEVTGQVPSPHLPELEFKHPALAGGLFLGLLSSLPIVSAGNCVCCMWILGGGGIATFYLLQQRPGGISYGDAAFGGVMSGLFGAVVATLVSIPIRLLLVRAIQSQQEAIEEAFKDFPIQGPIRDLFLQMASGEVTPGTIAFGFFMNLLIFSLFAMVGAILTLAVLNKNQGRRQSPPLIHT